MSFTFPTNCFPRGLVMVCIPLVPTHHLRRTYAALCLLWQSGRAEQIRATAANSQPASPMSAASPRKKKKASIGLPRLHMWDFGHRSGGCSRGCGSTQTIRLGNPEIRVAIDFPQILDRLFVVLLRGSNLALRRRKSPEGHVRLLNAFSSSTQCRDKGPSLGRCTVHFASDL